jgi:S-formylglutathione hydrolase
METGMLDGWSRIDIAGKSADVFDPPQKPRFGLLFLHGIGGETLSNDAAYSKELRARNVACICPRGGRCWWLDRQCDEFDPVVTPEKYLLASIVPYFAERWNLRPRALAVAGISMGGQGAIRLAFRHPAVFPVAAGIASAFDFHEVYGEGTPLDQMFDSKEQARQDTALMWIPRHDGPPHVRFCIDPDDHPWHRGNDRLHEKMNALGAAHTHDLETRAGGHSWQYFDAMAEPTIRFVVESLDAESRRLM